MAKRFLSTWRSVWVPAVAICLLLAGCRNRVPDPEPARVEVVQDPASQRLTITAEDVPRYAILGALRDAAGIEVRPFDVANDSVTVDVKNQPVTKAVEAILPPGAGYALRVGSKDLVIEPDAPARKVGPPEDRRRLPKKSEARLPLRPHLRGGKPPANRWRPPRVVQRGNVKADPRRSLRVPPGTLPKIGAKPEKSTEHVLRVALQARNDDGTLQVRWAHIAEGSVSGRDLVRGPFVYVLRKNTGEALAFGTVFDPFAVRAYDKTGRHATESGKEGDFGIWLPITVNASGEPDTATVTAFNSSMLELYDGRGRRLPRILRKSELKEVLRRTQLVARARASVLLAAVGQSVPDTAAVTKTLLHGGDDTRLNLVIIGDGFKAGEQQDEYDQLVQELVLDGVFNETSGDTFREIMNGFNIYRINATSLESGLTRIKANGLETVNTFFGYRYYESPPTSCFWAASGNTVDDTLAALVPSVDYLLVLANVEGPGACALGRQIIMGKNRTWKTVAHELGHLVGNLGDEYDGSGQYTCEDPSEVNLAKNVSKETIRWTEFVHPGIKLPPEGTGAAPDGHVGAYPGGVAHCQEVRRGGGLYHPAFSCRMKEVESPAFCSICYDQLQHAAAEVRDHGFSKTYVGQFDGTDGGDVVVHNGNSLALYTGSGSTLNVKWVRSLPDPEWGTYQAGDQFFVGDFNKDKVDDLYVFNGTGDVPYFGMLEGTGSGFEGVRKFDGILPGWGDMRPNDQIHVADFDGDDLDDIIVLNTDDWDVGYLVMLRSTGTDLEFVHRYDLELPGWSQMRSKDQIYVGRIDSDKRDDLYIVNTSDWPSGYVGMLKSAGNGYTMVMRYDGMLPDQGVIGVNDQFEVADFDGDSQDDLYVFNGDDWDSAELRMMRNTGTELQATQVYTGSVSDWGMRSEDRWYAADLEGNGREGLYVFNSSQWQVPYLGMLRSSGTGLSGGWAASVGSWEFSKLDEFLVVDLGSDEPSDDLVVYKDDALGLLRSGTEELTLSSMYPNWVHNHAWHQNGWW